MEVWIFITFNLLLSGVCMCMERQNTLQQLITQLEKLGDVERNEMGEAGSRTKATPESSIQRMNSEYGEDQPERQKEGGDYESALRVLRKLMVHNKRDHVIPAVDLSHFSCTQEYYGLRHIVDNLAKKYCVVKNDHVHDNMDGF
ncbi:uncharacterized protein LOC125646642 [Ostrea edulis]|uniref:uncharacterized protein LOC125646642 n=1 Tax=Ostrea edulis TaxID=37623 RepID=UPI0024AFCD80|nr:uncharacterized protein LOC125646642 [Ostrea edulis]